MPIYSTRLIGRESPREATIHSPPPFRFIIYYYKFYLLFTTVKYYCYIHYHLTLLLYIYIRYYYLYKFGTVNTIVLIFNDISI